jgi:inosose dehydratase
VLKVGHTGITWGYPEDDVLPEDVGRAYAEVAELGYGGFETFGSTILADDYANLARRCGIPTVAAYCERTWIDPSTAEEEIATALHEARELRAIGGETLVLASSGRPRPEGCTEEELDRLAACLMRVAEGCADLGLRAGLHPHTGTAIETRAEIEAILRLTEAPLGFAPDSGQIAKGGADVVEVFGIHLDRIVHVHLKDWNGVAGDDDASDRSGYLNYAPVGEGILPIGEILELLDGAAFGGWVNVELDGTDRSPHSPKEAAAISKAHLEDRFGSLTQWRADGGEAATSI